MDLYELVREAKQGSAAAQRYLFDLLADKTMMLCRRYVKNRENAEEIMLDGFYKFFKALPGFGWEGEAALHAWIKRIMINECLMFLRKKNVFIIVTDTFIGLSHQAPGEFYDKNTFRLGVGSKSFSGGKLALEPLLYFHDIFQNTTPGLRLTMLF
jgi:DNA-directed RNA polymerase specialized sigma24 family protein